MKVVGLKIFTETLPGANQLIFSTVMKFGRTLLLRFICHREIVLVLISADVALLRTSTPKHLRENDSRQRD